MAYSQDLRDRVLLVCDREMPTKRVAELIELARAWMRFRPPCSPHLNPIEMVFAKIKQPLRPLACRTRDALWDRLQSVLDLVTPADAANCFSHCGYTLRVD